MNTLQASLNVLIADDEQPARNELAFLLHKISGVGTIKEADSGATCLMQIEKEHFDAIFLDVLMPDLDGLTLAKALQRMQPAPLVVFVTAHESYAVDAFGLGATDYLLKPVRLERLQITLKRLLAESARVLPAGHELEESHVHGVIEDRLAVVNKGSILLLPIGEIRIVIAGDDQVLVRTASGQYGTRLSMAELEERLSKHGFLRVHRRFLVNLNHITTIDGFFNGTYLLKLNGIPDLVVTVSRRQAHHFRSMIGI